jgi:dipeptidyl aminopeptidase/acylaminoacyl peptidase
MTRRAVEWLALLSAIAPLSNAFADVPDEYLETPLALAFGAPPSIGRPMLSGDGTRLLFLQQTPQGVSILRSLSFDDGAIATVLQGTDGGYDISWCKVANETRVFCLLRQGMPDFGPAAQRLVSVNVDGTDPQSVPQLTVCLKYDHARDQPPIDWIPDDPAEVLLHCSISPARVDMYSSRVMDANGAGDVGDPVIRRYVAAVNRETVATHQPGPGDLGRGQTLYSNGHGFINLYRGRQNNLDHWFMRANVGTPWHEFLTVDPLAFDAPFRPIGYGADLSRVFNIGWNSESGTWALFRQSLTDDSANELVFAHDSVDVELVDTMGKYQRVVSAAFLDGRSRRAIVDARVAEVYRYVSGLLPELEVEIVDESWDQTRYLARVRAPDSAGEFLLVDMANESVQPLGPEYEHLTGYPLAETRLIEIASSTGGTIAAHLTLPHGVAWSEPEAPVPAVVIPRARPSHEDVADPHYLVQFLAANGYAVLRVANRVEADYGRGWAEERAVIGWRQSAADIKDAADYLVAGGITARDTICAAGKDYGAYTAVMTAIEYPALFRCIVGIGAVGDPRETPGGIVVNAGTSGARAVLNEASPLRRADELDVPTLLFHGRYDYEFRLSEHSAPLANALERADKDVVFVEYPEATHEIGRGPDRIDMLTRMRGFLAEQIGPSLADDGDEDAAANWRL